MISINGYPICDILWLLTTYLPTGWSTAPCEVSMLHVTQLDRIVDVVEEASRGRVCTLLEKTLGSHVEVETGHVDCKMDAEQFRDNGKIIPTLGIYVTNMYPLVICYIAMENGPFIDGLPINSMVIFHGYVTNNQMVEFFTQIFLLFRCFHSVLEISLLPGGRIPLGGPGIFRTGQKSGGSESMKTWSSPIDSYRFYGCKHPEVEFHQRK